jgi:proton-translocating NADH-quinone oxidoreductase chain N
MTWLAGLIGLPCVTSPLVYAFGHRNNALRHVHARDLALLMLVPIWLALFFVMRAFAASELLEVQYGAISLRLDGIGLLMIVLAVLLTTLVTIFSREDLIGTAGEEKFYASLLLMLGTVIGLVCANDLFNMWVWFEGMAISSYLLVAYHRQREDALGASTKYFIQTVSGSILVLFGIALVLMHNGTLDLDEMIAAPSPLLLVAGALFVLGFGVKLALFPNYTWLPDSYCEAPTGISALLSGVVTMTGLIAMMRALAIIIVTPAAWGGLLMALGMINTAAGTILAFSQTKVKRILAYSSIGHIGYVVLAIGIGISAGSMMGLRSGMLHLFVHGLMKALAFMALGGLAYTTGCRNGAAADFTVEDLKGLAQRYPGVALSLAAACLSLVGIPPFGGFVSKFQILLAGVQQPSGWIVLLIVVAGLFTVAALAYFLPIVNTLYDMQPGPSRQALPNIPLSMRLPIFILAIAVVVVGLWPDLLDSLIDPASAALLTLFG